MSKHDDEMFEEKKEDAKTSIRIDSFKSKGFSERDAIIKGMVSMKRSEKETKDMSQPTPIKKDPYPYGLRLTLEEEDLEKLEIETLTDVGKDVTVTARATVKSVSSRQNEDDEKRHQTVELQITSMKLT